MSSLGRPLTLPSAGVSGLYNLPDGGAVHYWQPDAGRPAWLCLIPLLSVDGWESMPALCYAYNEGHRQGNSLDLSGKLKEAAVGEDLMRWF
jgi:hypothetical protein